MFIGACLPSGAYAFLRIGGGCSHIQGLKLSVRAHAQWPKLLNSRRGRGSLYTQSGGKGKESTYKLQALVSYQYTHAAAYKGSVKFAGNVERCCTTIQERRIDKGVFLFFLCTGALLSPGNESEPVFSLGGKAIVCITQVNSDSFFGQHSEALQYVSDVQEYHHDGLRLRGTLALAQRK